MCGAAILRLFSNTCALCINFKIMLQIYLLPLSQAIHFVIKRLVITPGHFSHEQFDFRLSSVITLFRNRHLRSFFMSQWNKERSLEFQWRYEHFVCFSAIIFFKETQMSLRVMNMYVFKICMSTITCLNPFILVIC